jgi:hypothetical protein
MIQNLTRARRILEESPNMSLELAIVHANKQEPQTRQVPPLEMPLQRQFSSVQSNPINIPDSYSPVTSPTSPHTSFSPQTQSPMYRMSTNVIHSPQAHSPIQNGNMQQWMTQQNMQNQQPQRIQMHRSNSGSYGTPPPNLVTRNLQNEELHTRMRSNSMNAIPVHHQPIMQQLHNSPHSQNNSPTGTYQFNFQQQQQPVQQNWINRLQEMRIANSPPSPQHYSPPTPTNQQAPSPQWEQNVPKQNFVPIRSNSFGNSPVQQLHMQHQPLQQQQPTFSPTTGQQPFLRFNDRSFLQELNSRENGPSMFVQQNNNNLDLDDLYNSGFMNTSPSPNNGFFN